MRPLRLVPFGLLVAVPALGQTMRDYTYERPLRGERQLRAVVEFAAGRLLLRQGPANLLYGMVLSYDAERFTPLGRYDTGAAQVRLGVTSTGSGGIRVDRRRALPQLATMDFPASVDLALEVSLGASEGTLSLGGLKLTSLELKSGASRATISFDRPNRGSCRSVSVESGAGELTVVAAGNSGCRAWRLEGGVGAVTLDLGGAWPAGARMVLNMALGGVTLVAPRDLGLKIRVSGFLSGFDAEGFGKDGKTWTSDNFAGASRKLEINVTSAMGGVRVEWK